MGLLNNPGLTMSSVTGSGIEHVTSKSSATVVGQIMNFFLSQTAVDQLNS